MAIDAYLQIEGIKGESQDDKHRNWIEVSRVIGSVHQPRASTVSTAGGHTTGRASLSEITFEKLADLASPVLRQHCAMGKTLSKAVFEFMRADGDGKPICYERMTLTNVMISGVTFNSGDGGTIKETVHLAFSKVNWEHVKQSIRGGTEGSTLGGMGLYCEHNLLIWEAHHAAPSHLSGRPGRLAKEVERRADTAAR